MCGIVAVSAKQNSLFELTKALNILHHRGPDDQGEFISENKDCYLGQTRLSIIDLSQAGHQPMTDHSKRFVLTFNGEIYNFLDLKNNLEKKHGKIEWVSTTDSEVIIEGYAREGIHFLKKLNGIFAFSIYDKLEKTVLVLRDPIGVKPLYYTNQNGSFYFASELKAIQNIPHLKKTLRKQSMADQLSFMYIPEPYTMFNEFFKHEPGKYKIFKEGNLIKSGDLFGHLIEPISFKNENELIDQFYETFSSAVKRQMISDVPVSLFLSGGLDSSAIASEVVKHGGAIKDAYTISFSADNMKYDQQSDDLYFAKIIADKFDIDLNIIEAKEDMLSLLHEVTYHLDDAIADPASINTYLISKGAREQGIKVMLSGQGADEYLGGYRKYAAELLYSRIPPSIRKILSVSSTFIPNISGKFNANFRRLKKFTSHAGQSSTERMLEIAMWNKPQLVKDLFINSEHIIPGQSHLELFEKYSELNSVEAMMAVDQHTDLMSLNLTYTDKMSMMTGVEARVPFLDFELVRLMNSIPLNLKIRNQERKYILKKAMEPYLPHEIIYRSKAGFGSPLRAWFRGENELTMKYFDKSRIKKQEIFNPDFLNLLCKEQFLGLKDNSYTLFSMLILQIWMEVNGFE
jgi:asparagine synthase (glutamine-hydrolysing)